MKKVLALVVLILTPAVAFAQGTVVFMNNASGLVQQWTSLTNNTLIPVPPGGGSVDLLVAPVGTPLVHPLFTALPMGWYRANYYTLSSFLAANRGWEYIATTSISSLAAGQFNGGTVTINNIAEGANAEYMVIGWTGNYASYDAAIMADDMFFPSSFFGILTIATTATGDPMLTPAGVPVPLSTTFSGMTLIPVTTTPEPSTVALASVSAITLMLFRRRK